ncbi:hypothetical protein J5X84_00815 [Streptosporangiaceae bacterium NEAU-GS5]|nr:hypothetical protein [Streptosporangiaceae bacterium NEAU-GS5]
MANKPYRPRFAFRQVAPDTIRIRRYKQQNRLLPYLIVGFLVWAMFGGAKACSTQAAAPGASPTATPAATSK